MPKKKDRRKCLEKSEKEYQRKQDSCDKDKARLEERALKSHVKCSERASSKWEKAQEKCEKKKS